MTYLEPRSRSSCDTFYCVDGQECVERRYGEPVCECISECKEPKAPVCGSNGKELKAFESECELLKYSCEMKDVETIIKVADTSCEEGKAMFTLELFSTEIF